MNFFSRTTDKIKISIAISLFQQLLYILGVFYLGFVVKQGGWEYFFILIGFQLIAVIIYIVAAKRIDIYNLSPNHQEVKYLFYICLLQFFVLNFFTSIYGLVIYKNCERKNKLTF